MIICYEILGFIANSLFRKAVSKFGSYLLLDSRPIKVRRQFLSACQENRQPEFWLPFRPNNLQKQAPKMKTTINSDDAL